MKPQNVDPELMSLLENEFLAGEDLKWVGHPDPMRMALQQLSSFVGGIVIAIFMLVIFGAWIPGMSDGFSTLDNNAPPFFVYLFPLIFAGASLHSLLQPVFHYIMALRTIYAITNRRILTLKKSWQTQVISYGERDIDRIERRDRSHGKGDIIIAYEERTRRTKNGTQHYTVPIGLFGVDNVREVEALLLETFHSDENQDYEKPKRTSVFDEDDDQQALYNDKFGR